MMVKIQLANGSSSILAEGDVDYVEKFIKEWKHLVEDEGHNETVSQENDKSDSSLVVHGQCPNELSRYENVYAYYGEDFKIIATMPGGSKAEKSRNCTLVLLYGEYLVKNEMVSVEKIRDLCIDQGCYNSTNFSKILKSLDNNIVYNSKQGGDYDVKLTAPGRKAARELVEKINQSNDE